MTWIAVCGKAQRLADPARDHVRALAGDIEPQFLVAVAGGDDAARFHRRLRNALVDDRVGDLVRRAVEQRCQLFVDILVARFGGDVVVGAGMDRRPASRLR